VRIKSGVNKQKAALFKGQRQTGKKGQNILHRGAMPGETVQGKFVAVEIPPVADAGTIIQGHLFMIASENNHVILAPGCLQLPDQSHNLVTVRSPVDQIAENYESIPLRSRAIRSSSKENSQ
jgi:hypothetical protein